MIETVDMLSKNSSIMKGGGGGGNGNTLGFDASSLAQADVSMGRAISDGLQTLQVFGAPRGTLIFPQFTVLPSILPTYSAFDLSQITVDHEVVAVLLRIPNPLQGTYTVTFKWIRDRDNALLYTYTYNDVISASWSWTYVASWIGWLSTIGTAQSTEITENGSYHVTVDITGPETKSFSMPFTITGIGVAVTAALTISNPTVAYNGTLNFTFSGFPANSQVIVFLSGVGGNYPFTADWQGNGAGSIPNVTAGTTLIASNSINIARAYYTVGAKPVDVCTSKAELVTTSIIHAGDTITVRGTFINISNQSITTSCGVQYILPSTNQPYVIPLTGVNNVTLAPGQQFVATGTFVMPNEDITVTAYAYVNVNGSWIFQTASPVVAVTRGTGTGTSAMLSVTNSPVPHNSALQFSFSGFSPNKILTVTVAGNQNEWASVSTGSGSGTGTIPNVTAGTTLNATDGAIPANTATAQFTVGTVTSYPGKIVALGIEWGGSTYVCSGSVPANSGWLASKPVPFNQKVKPHAWIQNIGTSIHAAFVRLVVSGFTWDTPSAGMNVGAYVDFYVPPRLDGTDLVSLINNGNYTVDATLYTWASGAPDMNNLSNEQADQKLAQPFATVNRPTATIDTPKISLNGNAATAIPATTVKLGDNGKISVNLTNTSPGPANFTVEFKIFNPDGTTTALDSKIVSDVDAGATAKVLFTSDQINFLSAGLYKYQITGFWTPDTIPIVPTTPTTPAALTNSIPGMQTNSAHVSGVKIISWGKDENSLSTDALEIDVGSTMAVKVEVDYTIAAGDPDDQTDPGSFVELEYSHITNFLPVVGTTTPAVVDLPANKTSVTKIFIVPITNAAIQAGNYYIDFNIHPLGIGTSETNARTVLQEVNVSIPGQQSNSSVIDGLGIAIDGWGKIDGAGNALIAKSLIPLALGDMIRVRVSINYHTTTPVDDIANVSVTPLLSDKTIDNSTISDVVKLTGTLNTTPAKITHTFDITITSGASGGEYNGTFGMRASMKGWWTKNWLATTENVFSIAAGTTNDAPVGLLGGLGDIGGLLGMMIMMMVMQMMMGSMGGLMGSSGSGSGSGGQGGGGNRGGGYGGGNGGTTIIYPPSGGGSAQPIIIGGGGYGQSYQQPPQPKEKSLIEKGIDTGIKLAPVIVPLLLM